MTIPSFASLHVYVLAPELWLMVTSLVVLVAALFMREERSRSLLYVALVGVAGAIVTDALQIGPTHYAFFNFVVADPFATIMNLVVLGSAFYALGMSPGKVDTDPEYVSLILWATVGMLLLDSASNLMTVFIGVEVLSLPLYILAGYHRHRLASSEAAVKYLLLGAFSSGFLLYGIALLYGATGSTDLNGMSLLLTQLPAANNIYLDLGVGMFIVGLAFKLALIPFHMWVPDVYEGSPSPVTAFMSVGTKAAAFAALMRVLLVGLGPVFSNWQHILWFLAVLTILGGNLMALTQTNLKRLLGYSGIAQAGYIIVALLAMSPTGISASLFYLIVYALMNLGAFAVIVGISKTGEEGAFLEHYRGLFYKRPLMAVAMTIFMLSLASIPPTAGFAGKFYILQATVGAHDTVLAIAIVVGTMISLYYYLKVIRQMFLRPDASQEEAPSPLWHVPVPGLVAALVILAVWGTLQFGILPGSLAGLVHRSLTIMAGY